MLRIYACEKAHVDPLRAGAAASRRCRREIAGWWIIISSWEHSIAQVKDTDWRKRLKLLLTWGDESEHDAVNGTKSSIVGNCEAGGHPPPASPAPQAKYLDGATFCLCPYSFLLNELQGCLPFSAPPG